MATNTRLDPNATYRNFEDSILIPAIPPLGYAKEKGGNEISRYTVFSGADATVIAYRDTKTPASEFRLEQLKKQLKDLSKSSKLARGPSTFKTDGETGNWGPIGITVSDKDSWAANRVADVSEFFGANVTRVQDPNTVKNKDGTAAINSTEALSVTPEKITYADKTSLDFETLDITGYGKIQEEIIEIQKLKYYTLGSVHTLSYSSFREKFAVRGLGTVAAKTYTRGPRTLAGTLVFNTVQEQELLQLANPISQDRMNSKPVMLDQLEPFHLMILLANEYGSYSAIHLLNVELGSEGESFSIDEAVTRNSMNYYATDYIPPVPVGLGFRSYNDMINGVIKATINSSYLNAQNNFLRKKIDHLGYNPFAQSKDFLTDLISQSRGLF